MKDFDKRFKRKQEQFDRDFNRLRVWSTIRFVIVLVAGLSIGIFVVWVIVTLLQFIGAI